MGVEVATCSHAGLLMEDGFLQRWSRLESHVPIAYDGYMDGLVIDDVFMISKEEVKSAASDVESLSFRRLMDAKKVYTREALAGSDDKDVLGACDFKVCGVEVLSNERAVSFGSRDGGSPYGEEVGLSSTDCSGFLFALYFGCSSLNFGGLLDFKCAYEEASHGSDV